MQNYGTGDFMGNSGGGAQPFPMGDSKGQFSVNHMQGYWHVIKDKTGATINKTGSASGGNLINWNSTSAYSQWRFEPVADEVIAKYENLRYSEQLQNLVDEVSGYEFKIRYDFSQFHPTAANPGLITAANFVRHNAPSKLNGAKHPRTMFDGNMSSMYMTGFDGVANNPRDQRHWVEFKFSENKEYDQFLLCFTHRQATNKNETPVRIAITAPKLDGSGEYETVYEGDCNTSYPYDYSGKILEDGLFVNQVKLSRPVNQFRFVVLKTNVNRMHPSQHSGPWWCVSEMRYFDLAQAKENDSYKHISEEVKNTLHQQLEQTKKAIAAQQVSAADFESLENAFYKFKVACDPLYILKELVKEVKGTTAEISNPFDHSYVVTREEYLDHPNTLVKQVSGNANNANNYYKPDWLFDNDHNSQRYYATEGVIGNASRPNPLGRHWITITLKKPTQDFCLQWTCIVDKNMVYHEDNYGNSPTRFAIVAPKKGEGLGNKDAWTDTLYMAKSLPTYTTVYNANRIYKNSSYIGRFKLDKPIDLFRFVCLETANNPASSAREHGPNWGLTEMRVFDGREFDESPTYRFIPSSVKDNLNEALVAAESDIANNKDTGSYSLLKDAYGEFNAACAAFHNGEYAFWNTFNWGTAYGSYKKTAETEAIIAELKAAKGQPALWDAAVEKFLLSLQVNSPKEGDLLRIKSNVKGKSAPLYLAAGNQQGTTGAAFVDSKMGANEASTIFCYNNGQLSTYANGYYLSEQNSLPGYKDMADGKLAEGINVNFVDGQNDGKFAFRLSYLNAKSLPQLLQAVVAGEGSTAVYAAGAKALSQFNLDATDGAKNAANYFEVENVDQLPVVIGESKYASLYAPVALSVPAGVKAYTGVVNGNSLLLEEITANAIPAHTGVILVAETPGTYNFAVEGEASAVSADNAFKGNVPSAHFSNQVYTLQLGSEGVGMYPYNGQYLYGFKAYVEQETAANLLRFVFDGEQTGIDALDGNKSAEIYYDLNGRRVFYPAHGVYVTGEGKKVLFP